MKYIISVTLLCLFSLSFQAQNKTAKNKPVSKVGSPKINWMSIEEVQEKMKFEPKKIYIDIYSEGNGWCRIMQNKIFTNKNVIQYINENFYAVHFDAETKDSVTFNSKKYGRLEESGVNELAAEFMGSKIRYPYSLFYDEKFSDPQPIPGYLDLETFEMVLKYIATNKYKKVRFDKFKDEFKGTW